MRMAKFNLSHSLVYKGIFIFITALFYLCMGTGIRARAQETEEASTSEIVVVLDCSQSMKDADAGYAAFDVVKALAAVLPRDYRVGLVAYQEEVCAKQPLGSSHEMMGRALEGIGYADYGNAGAGLWEAVSLLDSDAADKRIILISDGEIMMKTQEGTEESAELFDRAVKEAAGKGIRIDVAALGQKLEEGHTVYAAAGATGGQLYELPDGEALGDFTQAQLLEQCGLRVSHVGQINGLSGELSVRLPDCLMSKARLVLLGSQQNENMTVGCEAEKMQVSKGGTYTVIELLHPASDQVTIQMRADVPMDVNAYLSAEYDYRLSADYSYVQATQTANLRMHITDLSGRNMLEGHLQDGGVQVYLDGEQQEYRAAGGSFCLSGQYEQDAVADLRIGFDGLYGYYYGEPQVSVEIAVPVIIEEEPPGIDWFFWSVIIVFVAALVIIFCLAYRQKKRTAGKRRFIDESRTLPRETQNHKSEFNGKLQIYVIHSKEEIDYPPESINLFARCNRDIITLEWLLDACNLPLNLKGAERIILKPGDDRSLIIKNNSKASVLMGRELLLKGHAYHLYYGEKVTFIFDPEDTEIEVHYRDLKPNER